MASRLLRKYARPRLLPLYAATVGLAAVAEPTPLGFALGGSLVVAGLALRAWGAGYLVKTQRLAMEGPYARVRHPLYVGSLLIGLGFGTLSGAAGLLGVLGLGLPFFLLYYVPYKERIESARLERRFGAAYAAYRARVPALLPRLPRGASSPGPSSAAGAWSLARLRHNHELGTNAAVLAVLLGFAVRLAVGP